MTLWGRGGPSRAPAQHPRTAQTTPTATRPTPTTPIPPTPLQKVLRAVLGYFTGTPPRDIPRLELPLHALIELTPRPDGTMEVTKVCVGGLGKIVQISNAFLQYKHYFSNINMSQPRLVDSLKPPPPTTPHPFPTHPLYMYRHENSNIKFKNV